LFDELNVCKFVALNEILDGTLVLEAKVQQIKQRVNVAEISVFTRLILVNGFDDMHGL
jgi:hypothetical protein